MKVQVRVSYLLGTTRGGTAMSWPLPPSHAHSWHRVSKLWCYDYLTDFLNRRIKSCTFHLVDNLYQNLLFVLSLFYYPESCSYSYLNLFSFPILGPVLYTFCVNGFLYFVVTQSDLQYLLLWPFKEKGLSSCVYFILLSQFHYSYLLSFWVVCLLSYLYYFVFVARVLIIL